MPYAPNNGVRIHYHVEGHGPALMMMHGWSDSLEDWHDHGYVDAMKSSYRMIVVDARGHGRSDKPHAPEAYAMDTMVSDMLAVLDQLGIDQTAYMGHSMGARMGYSLASIAPERITAFILGSSAPDNDRPYRYHRRARRLGYGMERYLAGVESRYGRMEPEDHRERFLANDALALSALTTAIGNSPGLESLLPNMDTPVLIYAGSEDVIHPYAQKAAESGPTASFVSLTGLDHDAAFKRSDMVVPHVEKFLASAGQ
jgi:pimeloyl-ACP methyl ester carboxylesterase